MTEPPNTPAHSMLDAILHSVVGGIVTADANGRIQTANPAMVHLFGYRLEELIGQNVSILMPEPDRSRHDGYMEHHLKTGERKIIGIGRDVEGRRKDGTVFPLHLSIGSFEVDGTRYFAGILHDLSTRSKLETEVKRQTALFQAVFDHVPEALIICDLDGRILLANPAASRVFGFSDEELTGSNARILFDPADSSTADNPLIDGRDEVPGPSPSWLKNFQRKDGKVFPGQLSVAVIRAPHGIRLGKLALIRDVTQEQKQAEARVKTQRLEAIGQLTGGVAHDFNNLLTIITGNLEFLEDSVADDLGRDHLKRAQGAAEAGARLTSRLLTFARRRRFEPQVIDLNDQVRAMTELLTRTLSDNIVLVARLSPHLWRINIDPSEVENTILNLAINARDAMPGGGRLVIETSNVTLDGEMETSESGIAPGDYVRLSVSDTGIGMTPDVLQRAFEPFFTTKPAGRGTGLGLSTIYGFVKQSNGNVVAYSEVGRGTTINLYLPRCRETNTDDLEVEIVSDPSSGIAGQTVLVVEDNPAVRAVTIERLRRLGCKIYQADTAHEAITKLEGGLEVNFVLSVMPGGLSGFDIEEWAKINRPKLPVILTSGFAEDIVLAEQSAKFPILRKPYSQTELANHLHTCLSTKRD
jgi:PAS domain S-box-containing protein